MKAKSYKGELTITRSPKNDGGEQMFNVVLRDEGVGRSLVKVQISVTELMLAITSLAERPCTYSIDEETLPNIGKVREVMSYKIPKRGDKPALPAGLMADGWRHWSGYGSSNALRKDKGSDYYLCTLYRYVEAPPDDFEPEQL